MLRVTAEAAMKSVRLTKLRMNNESGFVHVYSSVLGPLHNLVPVSADMTCAVRTGLEPVFLPAVDDEANVGMAHGKAFQSAETMICGVIHQHFREQEEVWKAFSSRFTPFESVVLTAVDLVLLPLLVAQPRPVFVLVDVFVKPSLKVHVGLRFKLRSRFTHHAMQLMVHV